ncbi:diphosphomevalonate decarboxylase [Bacillus sp. J14TS2]|uniref:diphosphomevalonate decarboxylase n=1 Tax=Bacillus sp. J14TS2 TaxID=2807188 RepID=UPI001B1C3EAF|nr:diphosphomevalonate decarboxylase [Bacillus sp. J14TS2]GIN72008.1 diphosphomevalonate decarboxylase [Bacillus sp. J14TS2]
MKATAKANTNIALIKYWGKRDEQLFLPMNSNLSITLDRFSTTTTVHIHPDQQEDIFLLNGQQEGEEETHKISRFLDIIRKQTGEQWGATVDSVNHVPTAAGFASSASGFAALAAAATKAAGLHLSDSQLSVLARQGSGSACRSIYGGFVEWKKGERKDGLDSYAVPILEQREWDLSILSVLVESKRKKVLSREGMKRTVETSPFYPGWLEAVEKDMRLAKEAIFQRDFEKLGVVLESNALKMHATTLGANPPFMYWQSATFDVMEQVQELRMQGIPAYFTIDAGPNVKVLCEPHNEGKVSELLKTLPTVQDVFICHPGNGVSYLNEEI